MTDSKDGKKKAKRGADRRGGKDRGYRRDPSKKNYKLDQNRRKGARRLEKERRG